MSTIKVHYIDDTIEEFPETSRPGGSYCTSYSLKEGFIIIKDAWNKETIIPERLIKHVESTPSRY